MLCVFAVGSTSSLQARACVPAPALSAATASTHAGPHVAHRKNSMGRVMLDWAPVRGALGYRIFRAEGGVWRTS